MYIKIYLVEQNDNITGSISLISLQAKFSEDDVSADSLLGDVRNILVRRGLYRAPGNTQGRVGLLPGQRHQHRGGGKPQVRA